MRVRAASTLAGYPASSAASSTCATLAIAIALAMASAAPGHAAPASRQIDADQRQGQDWLAKIQTSARKRNYSGTFVYQQGQQMRTSRIVHVWDGKNEVEKLEILDGAQREFIRTDKQVVCYVPATKTKRIERRTSQDLFPSVLASAGADLRDAYVIRQQGESRVAGYAVQSLLLQPRDQWRYGYRLWAEKKTGLLLKMETLDDQGAVLEQIAFTELNMHGVDRKDAASSFTGTERWRVESAYLEDGPPSGWTAAWLPPGFKKIQEVKRLVSEATTPISGEKSQGNLGRIVTQIVYSDGLAAVSVFVEPKGQHRVEGSVRQGAIHITGKRHGDFWVTTVGEAPAAAIKKIAESIQFKLSK
ncbi:MAG TPA: MucB/RseB C-terminal domain-containing protein [Burkholderiaceae bacterium]